MVCVASAGEMPPPRPILSSLRLVNQRRDPSSDRDEPTEICRTWQRPVATGGGPHDAIHGRPRHLLEPDRRLCRGGVHDKSAKTGPDPLLRKALSPRLGHQPVQGGPLEGGEPGDDQGGHEIVQQPPRVEQPRAIDRHEAEGDPVPQAVAATGELPQPCAGPYPDLTMWPREATIRL